jgi:hypothetical protein
MSQNNKEHKYSKPQGSFFLQKNRKKKVYESHISAFISNSSKECNNGIQEASFSGIKMLGRRVETLTSSAQIKNGPGPDISVGIATNYGLHGSRIEYRWGRDISHLSRQVPGAHPASCTKGTGSLSQG